MFSLLVRRVVEKKVPDNSGKWEEIQNEVAYKHCTLRLKDCGPVFKPIKVNWSSSDHENECNSHTDLGSVNKFA